MDYDSWLLSGSGGPYDPADDAYDEETGLPLERPEPDDRHPDEDWYLFQ